VWREAAGPMRFDSGRVSLDLVGTRAGDGPTGMERLGTPAQLEAWIREAGLVPGGTSLTVDAGWLARFIALREVIRRLVTAELAGDDRTPDDLGALNDAARPAPPAPRALPGGDGTLARTLTAPPTCEALLAVAARDAVEMLTDALARSQLRHCEGEGCTLVYLDTSRGRRRRWCSSEVCGNRERVARHRRRTTTTAGQR
jgi:predicted RNA-binding Zn ribbon-like protein